MKTLRTYEEYKYFKARKTVRNPADGGSRIPNEKDPNEPFFNMRAKDIYREKKYHYEKNEKERLQTIKKLEEFRPELLHYLDVLDDIDNIAKIAKKGYSILLKNGDKLFVDDIDWDDSTEYVLHINGRRIPGGTGIYNTKYKWSTPELEKLIKKIVSFIDEVRNKKKEKENWVDFKDPDPPPFIPGE